MAKYLKVVKTLVEGFEVFTIEHVTREKNERADRLARLETALDDNEGVMIKHLRAPSTLALARGIGGVIGGETY